jgi:GDP-mannose 6-dehydrogenase
MRIVVVGFGWVGQANALSLLQMGYEVAYFDPHTPKHHYAGAYDHDYARLNKLNSVLDWEGEHTVYIVCVGDKVSPDGVQDISAIRAALNSLAGTTGTVVLRSTLLPNYLQELSFDFYVPEFLHEKRAVEESKAPHFFVIGRRTDKPEPIFFAKWEQRAYKTFRGTPEEASHIKYLSNLWNALRIAFVNEYGDAMVTPTQPSDVAAIERVIDFVFDGKFYMRYGRSFGGHCLPKDMRAFVRFHKDQGNDLSLLAGAYAANEKHEKLQGEHLLPEWFSAWEKPVISGRVALGALIRAGAKRIKHLGKPNR